MVNCPATRLATVGISGRIKTHMSSFNPCSDLSGGPSHVFLGQAVMACKRAFDQRVDTALEPVGVALHGPFPKKRRVTEREQPSLAEQPFQPPVAAADITVDPPPFLLCRLRVGRVVPRVGAFLQEPLPLAAPVVQCAVPLRTYPCRSGISRPGSQARNSSGCATRPGSSRRTVVPMRQTRRLHRWLPAAVCPFFFIACRRRGTGVLFLISSSCDICNDDGRHDIPDGRGLISERFITPRHTYSRRGSTISLAPRFFLYAEFSEIALAAAATETYQGVSLCILPSVFGVGVCRVLSWSGGVCGGCLGSWWCRRGGVGSAGLVERAVAQHAVDDVASSACRAHDRRVVAFAFGSFAVVVGA